MIRLIEYLLLVECTLVMSRISSHENHETVNYGARIWRGNYTSHEKHPYFAAVLVGAGKEDHLCGGAFVTSDMLITAAHCLYDTKSSRVTIKYGINSLNERPVKQLKVQAIYIHPKFDNKLTHYHPDRLLDFALVKLKGSISDKAMLINLPEPGEDAKYVDEEPSTFVGMGRSFGDDKSYHFKEVTTQLTLSRTCWPGINTKLLLCAFGDYSGFRACPGDSGSPVSAQTERGRVIIAINSASVGYDCTTDKYKEMNGLARYARVSGVMIWILETILERSKCSCLADLYRKWILHESKHR